MNDYHMIERRSAFWRNTSYDLEQVYRNVKNNGANKWVEERDLAGITAVTQFLNLALSISLQNERQSIDEKLKCLSENEKGEQSE